VGSRAKPALVAGLVVVAWAGAARGAPVSFVRATSQLEPEARGRYHPLNLLDGDPATVWCSAGEEPVNQGVDIVFKRKQRIDRVVVTPSTRSGRIVTSVHITDGTRVVTVAVGTTEAAEVFNRPLEGTTYTVSIATVGDYTHAPGVPRESGCLADVQLFLKTSPFGGGAQRLGYDPQVDQLVGAWSGGALGAPEKTLTFSLDGTWDWKFKPLLGGKTKRAAGEYRFRGERLLMRLGEAGRWADVQYRWRRVKTDATEMGAPAADYDEIELNDAVSADLAGLYNNARFE
jgi:hypothetical protein